MKFLVRIFANAIARRVAFVLVGLLFAAIATMFGASEAQAQTLIGGACPSSLDPRCDKGAAYAQCMEAAAAADTNNGIGSLDKPVKCTDVPANNVWRLERARGGFLSSGAGTAGSYTNSAYYRPCDPDSPWSDELKICEGCSSRTPLGAGAWSGVNGDMQMCQDGCTFEGGIGGGVGVCLPVVIDGTTYQHCTSWGPTGDQCSAGVGNGSLAPPDSDGDGSSDGNDGSPNNPGSGGGGKDGKPGEDGSSSCGGPDQPACEADGSNSGSGKGNTSGGGGNCQTPPSSTGDAILAQIAFQTWATRCAIEGNANAGGGNGGTGTGPGTGDGDGAKEGTLKAIKDWLTGDGQELAEPGDPWMDMPGEPSDWSLGLGAGSCPSPVSTSITFGGVSAPIEFSFQPLCDLAWLLNTVFQALGAFIAAFIIAGVRR